MKRQLTPKYASLQTLCMLFDRCEDFFEKRKKSGIFKPNIHFFIPENNSAAKKAVFWDVEAIEEWVRSGNSCSSAATQQDSELTTLLSRTGAIQ
jgi:hypothetical protein